MQKLKTLFVCTTGALSMGLAAQAAAQEPITLKFAMAVPPTHYTAVAGGQYFMDRAVELSGGKIKFEWYPGEQLGKAKDLLTLVQTGVADIADVVPSYVSEKLPLTGVAELPGQTVSSCEGTKVLYELTRSGKVLDREDFNKQKVVVLMAATLAPYKILTAAKPVRTMDDMKGLKIRSSGGAPDATIRSLGAVGVRLAGPEINEALTRKTIDGAMYPYMSLRPFGIESIRYAVSGVSVGTIATSFLMNESKFNSLPKDIQNALVQAGKDAGMNYCNYIDDFEGKEIKARTEIEAIALSPEEVKRWTEAMDTTKGAWEESVSKRGKPAKEALQAWDAEIKKIRAGS